MTVPTLWPAQSPPALFDRGRPLFSAPSSILWERACPPRSRRRFRWVFDDQLITVSIIRAGLVGAIVWNLMTWLLGLPSSSSHALFGGLIGAVIVGAGIALVNGWVIVSKVLLPAIVAPLVAGIAAA